ncbi:hypothetical protein PhCBS80983_g02729 [Powellomyces hirtus]|uniref:Uncharacterized protein n=1 Tax=Powellomyces hirtus TaxID=109895 RepID=A0A507E5D1_9FUNG|nr:hypothetical protein PhCBS80983_g02729 [Powellomyces hirtus]
MALASALDPLRGHQICFTISLADRPAVSKWLGDVKSFFATTALQAADASKSFALAPAKGAPGMLPTANNFVSIGHGGGGGGARPGGPVLVGKDSFMSMEDVLEGITVHYAVQLTSVLGHFLEGIRIEAAKLLFSLASIFDKKILEQKKKMDKISIGFQTDDQGYFAAVHELFHYIGPALAHMVVAIVAGLECFYTCPEWTVRGICNSALARLVYENAKIFLEEDQLGAIWNLFFSLNSVPLISKIFPDRIVIIRALGLLAPLYVPADAALTYRIIETLLRLGSKTVLETEAIKGTLRKIFEKLSEHEQKHQVSTKDSIETGFTVFINLINPHDEYAYDLLSWALETYAASLIPAPEGPAGAKAKKLPVTSFPALTDFIKCLANHFRATPPLVRYGACVSLHAALAIYPNMVMDNKELYIHIITGALDTDYLSAFLYVSMLEANKAENAQQLKEMLAQIRHYDREGSTYDELFSDAAESSKKELRMSEILDIAIKTCPPLAPKQLQKMANSLEYLTKEMQLRQLEIVRLWGSKSEKFDTFLMQTLVPYCNSGDEEIQIASIKVISSLIPSFQTASGADISFAWGYFHALMDHRITPSTLQAVLGLIKGFPLEKLADESREEFLNTLFKLIFNHNVNVRLSVYDIIGSFSEFWKKSGLFNAAIGILFLAIGDHNKQCAKKVLDLLFQLSDAHFRVIVSPLGAVKDALDEPLMTSLKAMDDLAQAMARDRGDIKELVEAITLDANVDEFWDFYLSDAPDNQLVNPDDYNYARNFVHSPFWVSLLLTKLGVAPPSLGEGIPRNVMPSTPAGKRRYICGFMLCLLPSCGMPDPMMRRAACISAVRSCFKGQALHPAMMRGLLEFVSQQMMAHKQWTFQLSALDILRTITRLKLPGVSSSVLIQYGDSTLDVAYNNPSSIVKIGALELIETFLLVFPHGVGNKLQEIRDVVRAMVTDTDPDVVKHASKIFPLIFRCTPEAQSATFVDYIKNEINTIQKGGPEVAGDPLVSSLTREERDRVVRLGLGALGAINDLSIGNTIVQELMPFLRAKEVAFRRVALSSVLSQLGNLNGVQNLIITWALLPLYADPSESVRLIFSRYLRRIPSKLEALIKSLPPHPDDSLVLPTVSWEDLLGDNASLTVSVKNINDILLDLDSLNPVTDPDTLPAEDDGFCLPLISNKLMARFKELAKAIAGSVPPANISEVLYHLQQLQLHPQMQAHSLLVISEFCCFHESTLADTIDMFVNQLSREITPENSPVVEACMLGLRNISQYSPGAFKQTLAKVSGAPIVSEGDLIAMFYLTDLIQEVCPAKAPELLRKYLPIITSQRQTMHKRLYAVYLCVELALLAGQDDMVRTLDAIQTLLDTTAEAETRQKVYGCLGKILGQLGPKHSLFRSLLNNAKKEIRSKNPVIRLRTLDIVKILAKYMSTEESIWFSFLYLADSNREVRNKSKDVMVMEGMLDFVMPAMRTYKGVSGSRRAAVMESTRLPSIDVLGVAVGDFKEQISMQIPLPDKDPFNILWYSSDRRRKFTERYGISEARFARAVLPLPQSIMALVEEKSSAARTPSAEALAKYGWLMKIETLAILRECIKKYTKVAADLVESILRRVEGDILPPDSAKAEADAKKSATGSEGEDLGARLAAEEDEVDIEAEVHSIDVLSNLLFAHDGIGDSVGKWIDRLRKVVMTCNENAGIIRESLYTDLESSFFFFNEYIDIPIVSDEQYNALEAFKAATQEATLEIVKTGKTDKLSNLSMQRNELNDMVDTKSDQLRRLTIIALHGISGYALFYALSTACAEVRLIDAFQFLSEMLGNEHRGIRIAAVEALVTTSMIQLESTPKPGFVNKIKTVVQEFLPRLVDENAELYRRKADQLNLMAQLVPCIKERTLRLQFIRVLVQLWRDPDTEVRVTSIKMIQLLGEAGLAEISECFKDTSEELAKAPDAAGTPPNIMKELAALINNEEYPEKDSLQDLLKWRFTRQASKA